ncbi:MAG: FtsX-like permease family protein [Syntrophobacterales bacterium]|nr:FtsX-like permease family protein [Syntrophobacterales bacterium]
MAKTPDRSIHFPLSQTVKIAILSLKIRWQRSSLIAISLVLAISFFAYVVQGIGICNALTDSSLVVRKYCSSEVGKGITVISSRQVWLITMSLLICLAGITNAQLMAVTERFREIGTFKCLGALDRFIVTLLVVETCIYGLIGGSLGGFLGILVAILALLPKVGIWASLSMVLSPYVVSMTLIVSVLVSLSLSLLGVLYPALLAAKMEPSVALRHEE